MDEYIQKHIYTGYSTPPVCLPGLAKYKSRHGWTDYHLGNHIIFSHRTTAYDASIFPDKLHTHSYYELSIFEKGCISYVGDNHEIYPQKGDAIFFPPNFLHTARLIEASEYERYVFYYNPAAFHFGSLDSPPLFPGNHCVSCLTAEPAEKARLFYLLNQIEYVLQQNDNDSGLLAYSYIIQLFYLLSHNTQINKSGFSSIPGNVLAIKTYVDSNFQSLSTTAEIADHFFYSREYVSRLFKQYFNTNLYEYLCAKKIDCSKRALEEGQNVTQAFGQSGYHSMSSFVNAFREQTLMTPSAYKKAQQCAKDS